MLGGPLGTACSVDDLVVAVESAALTKHGVETVGAATGEVAHDSRKNKRDHKTAAYDPSEPYIR
jgi:hypothetical protein